MLAPRSATVTAGFPPANALANRMVISIGTPVIVETSSGRYSFRTTDLKPR